MTYAQEIGSRLASLRAKLGWNMETICEKMNVTRQSIYRWETGAFIPRGDIIAKFADAYGVSADYLLGIERQKARWLPVPDRAMAVYCSNCGHVDLEQTDYCPDCGLTMLKEGQT